MSNNTEKDFSNSDLVIYAKVNPSDIMMLSKLIEGLGHLGVVTTIDKAEGRVMIQTTSDCWPDLHRAIEHMPLNVVIEKAL